MVDIHSHILYGIFDSPPSIDISIEIARQYVDHGFTHVVSTPHFNPASTDIAAFKAECDAKYRELNERLLQHGLSLSIIPGAEVMLSPDLAEIDDIKYLCIENTNYLLVEFPWRHYPLWAERVLFELGFKSVIPILAHPERNDEIFKNYAKFLKLIDSGLLTQINAISLFSGDTKRRIRQLFSDHAVSFIATDTHRPGDRMSCFGKAISVLEKKYGTAETKRIVENSAAVLAKRFLQM
jgi:protein-tyrosine phosphatase